MTDTARINLSLEGPRVSRITAGMMNLASWGRSPPALRSWIHACLDLGIDTFDHADIYGDYSAERLFGEALAGEPSLRSRLTLITKCGIKLVSANRPGHAIKQYDTSQEHILASVAQSLRLLRTDYLDLLLIHRPDPLMSADEVAEAFRQLHSAGQVRHFGVSNFLPSQLALLASRLELPLVTNQIEFSVLHLDPLENGVLDQCQRLGISPMAWSPLSGARLFHEDTARTKRVRRVLQKVGDAQGGLTLDQTALAWTLTHPARVVPVLGTGKLERLQRAVAAGSVVLSRQEWFEIWSASTGQEVP